MRDGPALYSRPTFDGPTSIVKPGATVPLEPCRIGTFGCYGDEATTD
jgi:hypothetical protein